LGTADWVPETGHGYVEPIAMPNRHASIGFTTSAPHPDRAESGVAAGLYSALEETDMRKVEQIEQEIRGLSREEFAEVRDWLLQQDWSAWDAQIATDSAAGRLDKLKAEALADHRAARTRPV
jgi:hypothetical protein